jgi:hypothetical protein
MNKSGAASHVEVIFAFVLFITFVAGAIYFVNPSKSDQSGEIASKYALDTLVENVSSQLVRYSFVVQDSYSAGIWFKISSIYSTLNAVAKKENGVILPGKQQGSNICVALGPGNFTSIELSDAFNSLSTYSGVCDIKKYSLASVTSEKIVSEKKIMSLRDKYYSDYVGAKSLLGVPTSNDFSFYLIYDQNNQISAQMNSTGISKYSYERNVKVATMNGETKFGILRVVVW